MRLAIPLLLLLAATAQAVPDTNPGFLDGAGIELPEDRGSWFCTLFVSAQPTAEEQRFVNWFSIDPRLSKLRSQTHFNVYSPKSTLWSRYWDGMSDANGVQRPPLISSVPAVVVHRPLATGGYRVVARFQAPSIYLADAPTLASAIASCVRTDTNEVGHILARPWNPNRPCPDCRPKPEPTPVPNVDVNVVGPFAKPLVPDIGPDEDEDEDEDFPPVEPALERDETSFMLILALISIPVALIVVAGGLVIGWQLYKPKHRFYKHR